MSATNILLWIVIVICIMIAITLICYYIFKSRKDRGIELSDNPNLMFITISKIANGYCLGEEMPCNKRSVEHRKMVRMLPIDIDKENEERIDCIQEFPMDTRKIWTFPMGYPSERRNFKIILGRGADDVPQSMAGTPFGKLLQDYTEKVNVQIETTDILQKALESVSAINKRMPKNNPTKYMLDRIQELVFNALEIQKGETKPSSKISPPSIDQMDEM